uniref:Major facilitator superfamily (MFS) profile domain-containing protein n=1 Tax=Acrobeloides nanus TaxID=290746 RepID=A0A914EB48_9BILA
MMMYDWPQTTAVTNTSIAQGVLANSPNHDKDIGCNTNLYDWCNNLTQVNVWVYYITYVIAIGCAFPSVNITMSTLFSRILGPRRQGTQQGILQMSGSVARMIGPILISYLYTQYGPRIAWIMEGGVILFTALLWVVFYRRMVPLKIDKNANSTNKVENGTSTPEKDDAEVSNEASHTESQTMPRLDLLPDDLKFIFDAQR